MPVLFAENMTESAHVVKVMATGYKRGASSAARGVCAGFSYITSGIVASDTGFNLWTEMDIGYYRQRLGLCFQL